MNQSIHEEEEDEPFFFFFFFVEDFFLRRLPTLSLSIRPFLASRFTIPSSVFFCSFFFFRFVSRPTIFSMYEADSFDKTPPLEVLEPRLA